MARPRLGLRSAWWLEWISRVVWVPALFVAVGAPIEQVTQRGAVVTVRLERPLPSNPAPGIFYVELESTDLVNLDVWVSVPWWARLLSEGEFALTWLAIGVGAFLLMRVLRSVLWGDPFDVRNPRRIGLLALCVVVGTLGATYVGNLAATAVLTSLDLPSGTGVSARSEPLSLFPLAVAGLVLVVAGVFQRGRQLAQETEGLI